MFSNVDHIRCEPECCNHMQAASIFDFELSIATPVGYEPQKSFIEKGE